MSVIQALVFSKEYFNKQQSENWIKKHKEFKPIKKVHEPPLTYRYRLKEPNDKYDYRMKKLTTGIKAVVAFLSYQIIEQNF